MCAAAELPDGRLVFAFRASGARFYDPVTRRFAEVPELVGVNVLSLLSGSQQILWAGTDGQGVLELYEDDIEFNKTDNRRIFGGKSSPVRAFFEDGRGDMYVATKGNGIYVLRADGSPGGVYDRSNGLDNPFVYALAEGYRNDMLIGHDGVGIDVLDFSTGRISPIEPLEGPASDRSMRSGAIRRTGCSGSGRTATGWSACGSTAPTTAATRSASSASTSMTNPTTRRWATTSSSRSPRPATAGCGSVRAAGG